MVRLLFSKKSVSALKFLMISLQGSLTCGRTQRSCELCNLDELKAALKKFSELVEVDACHDNVEMEVEASFLVRLWAQCPTAMNELEKNMVQERKFLNADIFFNVCHGTMATELRVAGT